MFGSIINRLILAELVKVFLLALTALTGLLLIAGLIQEASQRGLGFAQIITIIPLLIPNTLPYTIPATTLFATCVVYGRMAHDNEILVLKSAGVNILHTLKPSFLLGLAAMTVTMWLYYDIIPRTQRMVKVKVVADAEEVIYSMLKREGCFRQPGMKYTIYVREVQGKRLLDVIFKRKLANGEGYEVVARTREARLHLDVENNQVLIDMGRCVVVGEKDGVGADVDKQVYPIPLPESMVGIKHKNHTPAMTWEELSSRRGEVEDEIREHERQNEEIQLRAPSATATPMEKQRHVDQLKSSKFVIDHLRRFRRSIDVEIHMRPALAVGCLCFVLIGCPVGIWANRADYLSIFVICFLPVLFVYYPLLLMGMNGAKEGKIPPEFGCWAADIFLALVAVFMNWRLTRR